MKTMEDIMGALLTNANVDFETGNDANIEFKAIYDALQRIVKNKDEAIRKITIAIVDTEMILNEEVEINDDNLKSTIETLIDARKIIKELL